MKKITVLTVFLLLFTFSINSYALSVGDDFPDIEYTTLAGEPINYSKDFKGNKPILLFFWATW